MSEETVFSVTKKSLEEQGYTYFTMMPPYMTTKEGLLMLDDCHGLIRVFKIKISLWERLKGIFK